MRRMQQSLLGPHEHFIVTKCNMRWLLASSLAPHQSNYPYDLKSCIIALDRIKLPSFKCRPG